MNVDFRKAAVMLVVMLSPLAGSAQNFIDTGYSTNAVFEFAQWQNFTSAHTNHGLGYNSPEYYVPGAGPTNVLLRQYNPAIIAGSQNIYSYNSDMDFEVYGSSTSVYGRIALQVFIWGNEITDETLTVTGGAEVPALVSTNFFYIPSTNLNGYITQVSGHLLEWDLSGYNATNYSIRFGTSVHTSFDKARFESLPGAIELPQAELDIELSSTNPVVDFRTVPFVTYQLRCSQSLTNPVSTWPVVAGPISGDGTICSFTNSTIDSSAFYSVEAWLE